MGGFHGGHSGGGGHSSGGGFHSGHSSHSSHSSYHRSHNTHVRGVYIGSKRYTVSYGTSNGRPMSFVGSLLLGFLFVCIGVFVFLMVSTPRHATATITKASIVGSGFDQYEVYDFEYVVNGVTYTGYGDDDLKSDGTLSIEVGEKYTLYLHLISNNKYEFEDKTPLGAGFGGIFAVIGVFVILNSFKNYLKYRRLLMEVGDANNDGKINEYDLEYADKKNSGMSDGAYLGAKEATKENVYDELKVKRTCPYCGSLVRDTDLFCQQCGGRLTNDEKNNF